MTDFEKAVRYLCFSRLEENPEAAIFRYIDIENMVHGDTDLIEKYKNKYEKLLDLLSF